MRLGNKNPAYFYHMGLLMNEQTGKNGAGCKTEPTTVKDGSIDRVLWHLSVVLREISQNLAASQNNDEPPSQTPTIIGNK